MNLQDILSKSKLSKREIAEKSGIRVQRINEWLRGECEPRWSAVLALCKAAGIKSIKIK